MRRFCALTIAVVVLLSTPPHAGAEFSSELEPAYSQCYEDLNLLSVKGLIPPVLMNTRPLSRGLIAGQLAEGLRTNREALLSDPVGLRLVDQFAGELDAMGFEVPRLPHAHFWRKQVTSAGRSGKDVSGGETVAAGGVRKPSAKEQSARFEIIPYAWIRVDNVEPIYFRKLADRRIGLRGTFSTAGGMLVAHEDICAGNHSGQPWGIPDFGTLNALVEGEDFNTWLHRGYLRLNTKLLDVVFGRDWIRWGPGRTGTLGMGDATPALNHLLLRKRMKKFDFTTFVATLDYGDEEMLAGHRLEFRPHGELTIGVAEQVRFRSLQQAPIYLLAFYPFSLVEKIVGQDVSPGIHWRNNVMMTFDADWMMAEATRLYGEFLLDDYSFSRDKKPTQIGYQLGLVRSGLGSIKTLSLTAEFTKIHRYTYSQARRRGAEGTPDSLGELDFIHDGFCLGHPIGPDAEGYYLAARYDASASSRWDLSLEVRRGGELDLGDGWVIGGRIPNTSSLSGIVETSTRMMLGYTFYPEWWSGSWVAIGGGLHKVTNIDNRDGEDKDWEGIMKASLMVSW